MKKLSVSAIFIIVILFMSMNSCTWTEPDKSGLNLDFEECIEGDPVGWRYYLQPDFSITLDSRTVKSGKYAIAIEYQGDSSSFQAIARSLPNIYDGKKISLSGYIKTENITNGSAGLWMRIYGINGALIAFDDMSGDSIKGSNGWRKYEITLDMDPAETGQIYFGGLLSGKGKVWFDGLKITIDDIDISKAKPYIRGPFPAEKDKAYDNGSGIVFPELNEKKTDDLELLGRIWGFLKYHHPAIAKGIFNWDYELFRFLPEYLITGSKSQRDGLLLSWINGLGEIPSCKDCQPTSDDAFQKPDLLWIEKGDMNQALKDLLQQLYKDRNQGSHYYIRMIPDVGNPEFLHENDYLTFLCPDAGFQLLALYRYWNMINYFFPSKYLTDKDWNSVLKEYIPEFVSARTRQEYELETLQLIGEINDTHSFPYGIVNKMVEGKKMHAPFRVRYIEDKLVITEFDDTETEDTLGLKLGDVITHINGKDIKFIIDSMGKYYPASNPSVKMRYMVNDLLCSNLKEISITYISSNQIRRKNLTLDEKKQKAKPKNNVSYKFLNTDRSLWQNDITPGSIFRQSDIGYITLESIKEEDIDRIKKVFKDTKGIVIDIRNYPSTVVVFLLGSYFVSNTTSFAKVTIGNPDNPGEFVFREGTRIIPSKETYCGKLVVLVDENTQSQAEYTAMAFRAGNNTTIIGSQTAGADGNISEIVLPGGIRTCISGIGIYYPDGRETQRIGIVPDIEIKPTIKGIREGRDEVLEKAIEIIRQEQ
ncbi:MAG: peptidase S41 [Tannerella sp.]|nr:peptidase S41 [Tannerella sp.]